MVRLILVLALLLLSSDAQADVRRVWAVSDGEKVERDDQNHPASARNSVWDGRVVRLFGARNEIVAFQVIVEADARGIGALSVRLPELVSAPDRITYQPPAADPTDYGRPADPDLRRALHARHDAVACARGSTSADRPAAPADPTGWKPVQLVPENARRGRGGLPLVVRAEREPGDLDRGLHRDGARARRLPRHDSRSQADGARRTCPSSCEVFDFALPDENSMHAMVYYSSDQPELYHGRNLDAAYHRLAHRHRVELVHAYDEQTRAGGLGPLLRRGLHAPAGTRARSRRRQRARAALVLRPGPRLRRSRQRLARSDAWMTFLREKLPRGAHVPLHARRAAPVGVSAHPDARRQRPLESRARPGAADLRHEHVRRSPRRRHRHLVLRPEGLSASIASRANARAGASTGSTTAAARQAAPSPSTRRPPTRARRSGPPSSTTSASTSTGTPCTGGTTRRSRGEREPERLGRQHHVRQPRAAEQAVDDQGYIHGDGVLLYPGEERLHPEEDRGIAGPDRDGAAREPAARPAGPPVPDAGPQAGPASRWSTRCSRRSCRACSRTRATRELPGDRRSVRGGAAEAGARHRGARSPSASGKRGQSPFRTVHSRKKGISPFYCKMKLQPELHDARVAGGQDLAEAGRIRCDVRRTEIRVVERVEHLGAELDVAPLAEDESLRQREIEVRQPGPAHDADAGVAERLRRRAERGEASVLNQRCSVRSDSGSSGSPRGSAAPAARRRG